jgi:hypothetical protein
VDGERWLFPATVANSESQKSWTERHGTIEMFLVRMLLCRLNNCHGGMGVFELLIRSRSVAKINLPFIEKSGRSPHLFGPVCNLSAIVCSVLSDVVGRL